MEGRRIHFLHAASFVLFASVFAEDPVCLSSSPFLSLNRVGGQLRLKYIPGMKFETILGNNCGKQCDISRTENAKPIHIIMPVHSSGNSS